MAHANLPMIRLKARSISCDDWSVSLSFLGGIALRFRELIIVFLSANFVSHRKRCHRSRNLLPARLPLSPVVAHCCPDPDCQPHCCCGPQGCCDHALPELGAGALPLRGALAALRTAPSSRSRLA